MRITFYQSYTYIFLGMLILFVLKVLFVMNIERQESRVNKIKRKEKNWGLKIDKNLSLNTESLQIMTNLFYLCILFTLYITIST